MIKTIFSKAYLYPTRISYSENHVSKKKYFSKAKAEHVGANMISVDPGWVKKYRWGSVLSLNKNYL